MTSSQIGKRLDKMESQISSMHKNTVCIGAQLNLLDRHLNKTLSLLQSKVNAAERQLYAMYIVGGVHLMLMGFVLRQIFS